LTTDNTAGAAPDVTLLLKASVNALKDDPKDAKTRFKAAAADFCPNCGVKHRTITPDECRDRKMSEKTLSDRVKYRAIKHGWKHAHAGRLQLPDGRWITPMSAGWPDWTFAKAGHRVIFMELKKELAEPEPEQVEWLQTLAQSGNHAIIVRPSDLREGRVEQIFRQGSPL
jgi:hypothetical protein